MSNIHFRRTERYRTGGTTNKMQLSIPLPKSPSGMISRLCPDESCSPRLFQITEPVEGRTITEDQKSLVRRDSGTATTTCPYCGCDAGSDDFKHPDDISDAMKMAKWMLTEDSKDAVDEAFRKAVAKINRSLGGLSGTARIKVEYKSTPRLSSPPRFYREDLLRDLTCDVCGRRYGVYAIALFCPDCGARNLLVHFQREITLVVEQVNLAQQLGEGARELAYRLLGNAHEDVLTALETYLKVVYRFLVKHRCPERSEELLSRKLTFQNIDNTRKGFGKIGIDPFKALTSENFELLRLNIEKRHVIGHNLSIADILFSEHDKTAQVGRTVGIMGDDILHFAEVARQVIEYLEASTVEFLPHKGSQRGNEPMS